MQETLKLINTWLEKISELNEKPMHPNKRSYLVNLQNFLWISKDLITFTEQVSFSTTKRILDFGCGNGLESIALSFIFQNCEVIGIGLDCKDSSIPEQLHEISQYLKTFRGDAAKLGHLLEIANQNTRIQQRNILAPWPNEEKFDFIFSKYALYHVDDIETTIRIICNLLSPGGKYLLLEPTTKPSGNQTVEREPWRLDADRILATIAPLEGLSFRLLSYTQEDMFGVLERSPE